MKTKTVWRLEIIFPDNFNPDKVKWTLYPMDLLLKIVDILCIIEPVFKRCIKSRAEWVSYNDN